MESVPREEQLARTFVELADTLVDDFGVIDFQHVLVDRCVGLLGIEAAGLMLADTTGRLRVTAASTERARLLELFELQSSQGPCLDCYSRGEPVSVGRLSQDGSKRWPRFAPEAHNAGYESVLALPLRLRRETIGALNLFSARPEPFDAEQQVIAQALADVATIGLLQERGTRQRELLAQQLQTALDSRVVIERATGVLAERHGTDVHSAFQRLRSTARSRQELLSELSARVVSGETGI